MACNVVNVKTKLEASASDNNTFLKELEELAKGRYTDTDEEYMAVKARKPATPPIQLSHSFGGDSRGRSNYRSRERYGGNSDYRPSNGGQRYNRDRNRDSYSYGDNMNRDRGRDNYGDRNRDNYGYGDRNRDNYGYGDNKYGRSSYTRDDRHY